MILRLGIPFKICFSVKVDLAFIRLNTALDFGIDKKI